MADVLKIKIEINSLLSCCIPNSGGRLNSINCKPPKLTQDEIKAIKMKLNELYKKNDWQPYLICKTRKRPGLMDNSANIVGDMLHGDYNNLVDLEFLNRTFRRMLQNPYPLDPNYLDPVVLKNQWKDLNRQACKTISGDNELYEVANTMTDRVFNNIGGVFSSDVLNQRASNCSSTNLLIDRIKLSLAFELNKNSRFIQNKGTLRLVTKDDNNIVHYNNLRTHTPGSTVLLDPNGNPRNDIPSPIYGKDNCSYAMAIKVDDTWAHDISITQARFNYDKRQYSVDLEFSIFDHYGLDDSDVDPLIKPQFAVDTRFLSWFLLQHWHVHNKKPFITLIKFKKTIIGNY